jgi:hypothetical protein
MKKILILFILISSVAIGQDTINPIVKFLAAKKYKFPDSVQKSTTHKSNPQWPDTLYYNTAYKANLLGSVTIPISFSSIELAKGNYEVSPTVGLGLGYTWFYGNFTFEEDDRITVDPKLSFGLLADAGLANYFSLSKFTSFFMGGFIGIGPFTLFAGYDVVNRSPTIGLGGRIDFYTLSQKFLNIHGKVREVRKLKRIAQPITEE